MNELAQWAGSGAMWLTGRPEGPPQVAPGRPATAVCEALDRIAEAASRLTGQSPDLPGVQLLGERAAAAGLRRSGPWSCGGSFRVVETCDSWFGLSLPRPEDHALVPALVEARIGDGAWSSVAAWARTVSVAHAVQRARLLGLACAGPLPDSVSGRPPVQIRAGGRRDLPERPKVLDLTSLWAGPLCAHLLGLGGADVTKVESAHRPDGARGGPPSFFRLLHRGHRKVTLDFKSDAGIGELRRLIEQSDVVLEASRRRALVQLGIDAEDYVQRGIIWVSITARGRDNNSIGFGDDVAVGAGVFVRDGKDILPCGDALADPLAGMVAAAATHEALLEPRAVLLDVSMHDAARAAARGGTERHAVYRRAGNWWVEGESGCYRVALPHLRAVTA